MRTRQREARHKGITLLRKYRTGDLPDVAIKPSEILSPLMALSLVDPSLAQSLFSELFVSIFHSIAEDKYVKETPISLYDDVSFKGSERKKKSNYSFKLCWRRLNAILPSLLAYRGFAIKVCLILTQHSRSPSHSTSHFHTFRSRSE